MQWLWVYLDTDGVVLVDTEVEHEDLSLRGDGSKDGAGVGGPGHVPHLGAEVEPPDWLAGVLVPDLHGELECAGDEEVRDEGVPVDGVHRGVVGLGQTGLLQVRDQVRGFAVSFMHKGHPYAI